ncbi:MAG: acylphosphatase [Treponema sp.]|jgi:acylphosphatase|nr:acylphosphatase [Treponema sp.]
MTQNGFLLRIFGRIQGVGFRCWTQKQAQRLRVNGWVRNEADGSVTCECCGPEDTLQIFIKALRSGPPRARVDKIDVTPVCRAAAPRGFEITF